MQLTCTHQCKDISLPKGKKYIFTNWNQYADLQNSCCLSNKLQPAIATKILVPYKTTVLDIYMSLLHIGHIIAKKRG
jgi:hypothetical protein